MINNTKIKIAKKYQPMIKEIFHEGGWDDHYVAHLNRGFQCDGAHIIIEDTQAGIKDALKYTEPCNCSECKHDPTPPKKEEVKVEIMTPVGYVELPETQTVDIEANDGNEEIVAVTEVTFDYDLSTVESRVAFIKNEPSGLFSAKDTEGGKCAITMEQHKGMEIIRYQSNGWAIISDYDSNGYLIGEWPEKIKE